MVDGEKAVKPTSAFRLQGSRTDYSFLLQLIEEVSEEMGPSVRVVAGGHSGELICMSEHVTCSPVESGLKNGVDCR